VELHAISRFNQALVAAAVSSSNHIRRLTGQHQPFRHQPRMRRSTQQAFLSHAWLLAQSRVSGLTSAHVLSA
tara:strand:- start:759 stop:974 length:216 start_codon:yes stop_codon:yes gene_type:complete